jgi:hypothetical protein
MRLESIDTISTHVIVDMINFEGNYLIARKV